MKSVVMVTVPASALKRAFRKMYPDKSAAELYPLWQKFWASIVLAAKVEKVQPEKGTILDPDAVAEFEEGLAHVPGKDV